MSPPLYVFSAYRLKNAWWRVPICLSGGEHISRLGCIGEQQALLATSLVETLLR